MKFAICEDNGNDRKLLCKYLINCMKRQGMEADLCEFETAEEMMEAADKTFFSMFFLDILLPGLNGMDAALKLRRAGNYSPIVFTTVTKDYLSQSYSVWAVNYLVKPIAEKDVDEALTRGMKVLTEVEKTLNIMIARHTEHIPYSDIYYIEGNNNNCFIHTCNGVYNPYVSVKGMADTLKGDTRFCFCHRSYIANLDHVLAVLRDKVAMRNDVLVPIRRGDTDRVRRAYEDRRFELVERRE